MFHLISVYLVFSGMDSRCSYTRGVTDNCIAVFFAANACLCSGQALALFVPPFVSKCYIDYPIVNLLLHSAVSFHLQLFEKFLSLSKKWDRPLEWVPEEKSCEEEIVNVYSEITQIGGIEERGIVDIFSVHSETAAGKEVCITFYDLDKHCSLWINSFHRVCKITS